MAIRSDKALAAFLDSTIDGLDLQVNLFNGPVRAESEAIPGRAVFVISSGGAPPLAFNGELNSVNFPDVQIRVRGSRLKYDEGLDLALAVRDAAHYAPLAGFIDVRVAETDPTWLGEDDDGHPQWSINVNLTVEGEL